MLAFETDNRYLATLGRTEAQTHADPAASRR